MAIKDISAAWKSQDRLFPKYERVYADFRQYIHPPISSTLTYTKITSADNQPGSHNLTGGTAQYVLPMPNKFTLFFRCKPTFAYDTSATQWLWRWTIDSTHRFYIYYSYGLDKIAVLWQDGGTARALYSLAYTSNETLQTWHNIAVAIDLTTGTTAGSALYINQAVVDAAWDGNTNIKSSSFPIAQVRYTSNADWNINQIRYFPNVVATAAQVANLFKDIENEEIVWNFNGEGCGRTRCNITRHVMSLGLERSVEEPSTGSQGANRLTTKLYSNGGEYADDQYAAFDPTAECFNGTSSQKYLQKQSRIEAETWYGTVWEPIFTGRLDNNLFTRSSYAGELTTVDIAAEDGVSDIAREMKRKGKSYASKKLSDTTEADSLIHLITRLATKKEVYNYLANSSFENTTIANSWAVAGAGATLTRAVASNGLFGSYRGDLTYGSAEMSATQTVTFTGVKKLNVGETYNFSIWLASADASTNTIKLTEADSLADNDYTSVDASLVGNEWWKRFEVSHTITDSDSDRLKVSIHSTMAAGSSYVTAAHFFSQTKGLIYWGEKGSFNAAVPPIGISSGVLSMDGAMLIQGDRAHQWWVLNNNDGAAAVESADDADYDSYDTVGFDVDAVDVTHPWVFIPATTSIWEELKQVGDACAATYLGMDACGTLKMRAKLKTGYTDPSALETIDDTTAAGVESAIEMSKANKIIGHGVAVSAYTGMHLVWTIEGASQFNTASGKPKTTLTNGSYFPDPTTYGDFFAKYGEVE